MSASANGHQRVLVAIDDSQASWKALDYVAARVRGTKNPRIHLFHAVGPVPPGLREFGGAENPQTEEALERNLEERQNRWAQKAIEKAEPLLDRARQRIGAAGIKQEAIYWHLLILRRSQDLVDEILKAAEENHCSQIVVGSSSFPWIKEIFADHIGEELRGKSGKIAVEIVE
ncbi:MAG TPA: universal stress protein [Candidatus Acidoferrales bacterium]|nr:universal stress protein [Candidatus Acidoferrales bacterium]